jgi:hypothetical protein
MGKHLGSHQLQRVQAAANDGAILGTFALGTSRNTSATPPIVTQAAGPWKDGRGRPSPVGGSVTGRLLLYRVPGLQDQLDVAFAVQAHGPVEVDLF